MSDALLPLRRMMLIRAFEDALAARKDHGFQLLSTGEEAVAVGLSLVLEDGDQLLTGGRSIGPALARGVDPGKLMAELLGRVAGVNRGRAGRGHLSDQESGFFGAHAVVGGNISIAAGVALERKLGGGNGIVAILFGDGASGAGGLYETLNIATLWHLPLLFVCNNNQLSVSTPREASNAAKELRDIGRAFAIPTALVDGLDVWAMAKVAGELVEHVRSGKGPAFLECSSLRLRSHSTTARETRSRDELAQLHKLCPIKLESARLLTEDQITNAGLEEMRADAARQIEDVMAFADASPYPEPEEVLAHVE
ncbi:MAG: pyruvate dehydrogenase (acetyl-transferring) E1 component subunit alpha [Sphingomonadales bacterium]|nr:pyruvate dehydrogenase (acetyl-transferring) E1 component subunit alpha [Sphingomonadales bacterium]